jgi:hypothetical protein
MNEPQLTPEKAARVLEIIEAAEPDTLRKLNAYELEEQRLQHLLSLNPPQQKREQLERLLESIQLELWEIRASAAFLGIKRAAAEKVSGRGTAGPANQNP